MKKLFRCTNCGFKVKVRDELPDDYICPKCGVPKDDFVEVDRDRPPILLLFLYLVTFGILIISGIFTISTIFNQDKILFDDVETNPDIDTGSLTLELVGKTDTNITLIDSSPMSDEKAEELKPYEFNIKNPSDRSMRYRVKLIDVPDKELVNYDIIKGKTRISNTYIRYSLFNRTINKEVNKDFVSNIKDDIVAEGILSPKESISFSFRVWIGKDADNSIQNMFYAGRIVLEADMDE